MNIICISLFTWTNLRFATFYSFYGIINWILAFILKGVQLYLLLFIYRLLKKINTNSLLNKQIKKDFSLIYEDY